MLQLPLQTGLSQILQTGWLGTCMETNILYLKLFPIDKVDLLVSLKWKIMYWFKTDHKAVTLIKIGVIEIGIYCSINLFLKEK